ncbi:MAG TPA: DUF2298 domain-containing protein, partial [Chloroflexota bacterium]|nr:DUF2298 domain-containing protein [Chloroflexota bacterium]
GTTPYLYYLQNLVFWYLGPALGIAACAGLIWFGWRLLRGRASPGQALLLLWVIPYFLIVGRFWAKFGRYLLPIIPVLCCLAAAFLVMALRKLPTRWRPAGWSAIGLVCLSTAAWALAYMHIYETPNSQIQASRWIYNHLRPGQPFATEGAWDRSLPFCLPQPRQCPSGYNSFQLNLYDSDTGAKVARLVYALTHDQYIVMSTQRFIDSIPKQPAKYPITTRYYQLLFHNRLNFRLVERFAVHPQLGPWVIDDFPADENFTVFDHADVRIFRRVGPITAARARYLLTQEHTVRLSLPEADAPPPLSARVRTEPVLSRPPVPVNIHGRPRASGTRTTLPPVDAGARHQDTRLMLNRAQWNEDQKAPTYDQMFPPHGFGMGHPILVWLALVELLGLAMVPITQLVFQGLADRGWIVAKTVGLLFVAWAAWVVVSLGWLTYSFATLWAIIGVTVVIGAGAWWRMRVPMLALLRRQRAEVLAAELVFLAGFLAFVLLRMWYPDLGHQFSPVSPANAGAGRMGEKQLELAFLNAITRSQTFPPLDPFFSGGFINYYYFGYVMVATLCKATTIAPATGFNLAIPTFFGLLAGTSYSIGRALTRSRLFGLITVAFVGFIGNLNGLVQVVQDVQSVSQVHIGVPVVGGAVEIASGAFQATVGHAPLPPFDFWASTRILPPVGVNFAEFPYFTYLFGDLHAHLMAMPMDLAIIALALSLVVSPARSPGPAGVTSENPSRRGLARIKRVGPFAGPVVMGGLILGAIEATNPVDFPMSLVFLGMGFAMAIAVRTRRIEFPKIDAALQRSDSEARNAPLSWAAKFRVHAVHLVVAGGLTAITALLAVLLFPPLVQGYHPVFPTGLETVTSQAGVIRSTLESGQPPLHGAQLASAAHDAIVTPLPVYWETFGLFLFIIGTWVIVGCGLRRRQPRVPHGRLLLMLMAIGAVTLVLLDLWLMAFLLAGAAVIIGMAGLSGRRLPARVLFVAGITLMAFALTAFAEIFFIPDYLSGSLAFRMNTIAKVYTQLWLLYAISAAACLRFLRALAPGRQATPWSGHRTRSRASRLWPDRVAGRSRIAISRRIWTALLIIGVFGSTVYTFSGTVARETYRQTWLPEDSVPFTLDGMAFMRYAYPLDYAAINWLNVNVHGTPTIVEADQAYYNWRSRVVQFTGLPTLYGGIYESAQRYGDEVAPRQSVLEEIYEATASNSSGATMAQFHIAGCTTGTKRGAACVAEKLLRAYDVSYVYVGSMEQQLWPLGSRKFATMRGLTRVFHQGNTSIYHVDGSPT